MIDAKTLYKNLLTLFDKFHKQDNPVILRDISIMAYKLMMLEKDKMICCPECKEVGLIKGFCWAAGKQLEVFNSYSDMICEEEHQWKHDWKIGDRVMYMEKPDQFYVYECARRQGNYGTFFFERVNGERYKSGENPLSVYEN